MKTLLTTNHPTSSYNQPILLIDGKPFGCNDRLPKDYQLVFDTDPPRYLQMDDAASFVRKNWQYLSFDRSLAIKFVQMSYNDDVVAWVKKSQMVNAFGESYKNDVILKKELVKHFFENVKLWSESDGRFTTFPLEEFNELYKKHFS